MHLLIRHWGQAALPNRERRFLRVGSPLTTKNALESAVSQRRARYIGQKPTSHMRYTALTPVHGHYELIDTAHRTLRVTQRAPISSQRMAFVYKSSILLLSKSKSRFSNVYGLTPLTRFP